MARCILSPARAKYTSFQRHVTPRTRIARSNNSRRFQGKCPRIARCTQRWYRRWYLVHRRPLVKIGPPRPRPRVQAPSSAASASVHLSIHLRTDTQRTVSTVSTVSTIFASRHRSEPPGVLGDPAFASADAFTVAATAALLVAGLVHVPTLVLVAVLASAAGWLDRTGTPPSATGWLDWLERLRTALEPLSSSNASGKCASVNGPVFRGAIS